MIPKTIHQIWIGNAEMPERERSFCQNVVAMHPDWNYVFWDNESIKKLNPIYLAKMKKIAMHTNTPSFVVDYLKFVLLYEFGGLFLDVDFEMKNSLNKLDLSKKMILTFDNSFGKRGLQFCFAASQQKHEFVEYSLFHKENSKELFYFASLNRFFKQFYFKKIREIHNIESVNFNNCEKYLNDVQILDRNYFFHGGIAKHHYLHSHRPHKKALFTIDL